MLNLILPRVRAAELDAHVRVIDTQRRRADRAAATAKMTGLPPARDDRAATVVKARREKRER